MLLAHTNADELHGNFSCEPCEQTLPEQTIILSCKSVWHFHQNAVILCNHMLPEHHLALGLRT